VSTNSLERAMSCCRSLIIDMHVGPDGFTTPNKPETGKVDSVTLGICDEVRIIGEFRRMAYEGKPDVLCSAMFGHVLRTSSIYTDSWGRDYI